MATYLENLQTAQANIAAALAALTADLAAGNHKPSYTIDGQTVNWTRYQEILVDNLAKIQAQIEVADELHIEETQVFVSPDYNGLNG